MDSMEALEQRKKELLLRKEVARLEAQERTDGLLGRLSSWWIVIPLGLVGAYVLLFGIDGRGSVPLLVIGFALIAVAVTLRLRGDRRR